MIFRRKRDDASADEESVDSAVDPGAAADDFDELEVQRPRGPWDRSEIDDDASDPNYIDLGGIIVKGAPTLELRLQVDEQSQQVSSVMLAGPDSGVELRAFAAPRWDGIWDEVRQDIAAEAAKRGGTATESDGEYGVELTLVVPIQAPDGRQATQTSRIVGVDGPRWLLRGTFLGRSATEPDPDGVVESAFRDVVVVRGDVAMAPRDLIAMRVPQQIEVVQAGAADGDVVDLGGGNGEDADSEGSGDDPYGGLTGVDAARHGARGAPTGETIAVLPGVGLRMRLPWRHG